jgi:HD-GYP domain-containing protein (c-di-GMP phosphodiesterase class II)/putative methionine-R-sulfoxide reductase with GAF domain
VVPSVAHLKMLHGLSSKLSRLLEIEEIGATIADELRQLIDYHNCRVFLRDGDDLWPVVFRGDLTDTSGTELDILAIKVGVGVTGHVAATGKPFLTGDAANCGIGHHIEGTSTIEESLLAVPLRYGANVVGVLVLSKLGLDQFDEDDLRFLEVLAGHASVALVNARLYEAQRREAHGAKALLEFSRELSATTQLDAVAERVVRGAARILEVEVASLWLPLADGTGMECLSIWPDDGDAGQTRPGDRLTVPRSARLPLAQHSEPFVIRAEEFLGDLGPDFTQTLAESYAVAPIALETGFASLALALGPGEILDARRLDLLAGIGAQAKLALTNAMSFESLERTFLSTVEALANALEAKDEYTSSHARWIRDTAVRVGEALGLDSDTLKRVELGALFHDIGKIGIPASILTKPGPLTEDERALIETHPELGARILAPIEQLEHVRPIVRACHERYDGTGYPDRLRGDEIPLEARIIFICDAFHAMTTTRPYREALPVDEARRRVLDGSGSQFDPAIVEVCLDIFEEPAEE